MPMMLLHDNGRWRREGRQDGQRRAGHFMSSGGAARRRGEETAPAWGVGGGAAAPVDDGDGADGSGQRHLLNLGHDGHGGRAGEVSGDAVWRRRGSEAQQQASPRCIKKKSFRWRRSRPFVLQLTF